MASDDAAWVSIRLTINPLNNLLQLEVTPIPFLQSHGMVQSLSSIWADDAAHGRAQFRGRIDKHRGSDSMRFRLCIAVVLTINVMDGSLITHGTIKATSQCIR